MEILISKTLGKNHIPDEVKSIEEKLGRGTKLIEYFCNHAISLPKTFNKKTMWIPIPTDFMEGLSDREIYRKENNFITKEKDGTLLTIWEVIKIQAEDSFGYYTIDDSMCGMECVNYSIDLRKLNQSVDNEMRKKLQIILKLMMEDKYQ